LTSARARTQRKIRKKKRSRVVASGKFSEGYEMITLGPQEIIDFIKKKKERKRGKEEENFLGKGW